MKDILKSYDEDVLIRIFTGEEDKYNGKVLYEEIVSKARELGLAGATVIRGILGFGASSRMHSAKILRLSEDLPVIVEIADSEENVKKLLPFLDEAVEEGFVTIEKVKSIKYRRG